MSEVRDGVFDNLDESQSAKKALKREFGLKQIIGSSKVVEELREKINEISICDVKVLISGESGTGKELAARAIHYLSKRAGKPFIPVNCGAIPENLFENELFGHVKGAFTDARYHQVGLVKEADGGTLFLDEVGTASPHIQIKLLRLLQDKEYKPLGDPKSRKADIRIIAATNKDLSCLVKEGAFREDLYYRLNIVPLHIPPMRERKEDIPILAEYFARKYSREYNKPVRELSKEAMEELVSYTWPGNIRELENKIQQLVVMSPSNVITSGDIQLCGGKSVSEKADVGYFNVMKKKTINVFEKTYLSMLMTENRGNVADAARRAGKSRTALWNLIKKHSFSPKQFRSINID